MQILTIVLAGVLFLAGCGKSYQSERDFWHAGKILESARVSYLSSEDASDFDPAILALRKVADAYPGTKKAQESLQIIANLYVQQGNLDAARAVLEEIASDYANVANAAPNARFIIGALYEQEGNWKKAEETYWDTAEYYAYHPKGLYAPVQIITHYKREKDETGADRAYAKALDYYQRISKKMGPIEAAGMIKHHEALAQLAYGEWLKAREIWMKLAEEQPESPYAPIGLLTAADISWKRQDFGTAIEIFQAFIKQYPKHALTPVAYMNLGLVYDRTEQYEKAREAYKKALEYYQDSKAHQAEIELMIARSYQEEGKWDEALKVYEKIETDYGETTAVLQVPLMKGAYYEKIGQKEKQEAILDEAIAKYLELHVGEPGSMSSTMANRLIHTAYAQKGDWQGALANFDRNIEREESTLRKGSWHFLKAYITETRIQDNEGAISLYQSFLKEYPEHPLSKTAKSRMDLLKAPPVTADEAEIQQASKA